MEGALKRGLIRGFTVYIYKNISVKFYKELLIYSIFRVGLVCCGVMAIKWCCGDKGQNSEVYIRGGAYIRGGVHSGGKNVID